jgi:putative PIN family toxin of toxin-antitoxin system
MKVVVDSSVLIAASISRAGVCAELLEDVLTHHELVISDFILEELGRNLHDKFSFPPSEIRLLRQFLEKASTVVVPSDIPPTICRDPSDLPVIGTAVAGGATMLITVDKDLLTIGEYQGISFVRPGAFWRRTIG